MPVLAAVLALCLATAASAASLQAPVSPQSAPAEVPAAKTMIFHFEDTAVEDIVREVTTKFGITIEKTGPIPSRVTVLVPQALNEDQAVSLLNTILLSVHYAAVERHIEGDPRRILRVMTFDQAKKEAPVGE